MQILTDVVARLPEFQQLLQALEKGRSPAAVSGVAAVHRAHIAAGIAKETGRPVVMICADENEGDRLAKDLAAFSGETVPILGSRPFSFYPAAAVSHQWEHRRLSLMYQLQQGQVRLVVATIEGILQRTIPPERLKACCRELKVGQACELQDLVTELVRAGYTRCEQVEGIGQFALRGGILDVFAPGMDQPVRVDFFGDEIDGMGFFDVGTQRRTGSIEKILLLPAAEILPHMAPDGIQGLVSSIRQMAVRANRRRRDALRENLLRDMDELAQNQDLTVADRYIPVIYPQMATAADYFPLDTCIVFSESSRITERARSWQWQMEEDIKILLEKENLDPGCAELSMTYPHMCERLSSDWPMVYLDAFTTSGHPEQPKAQLFLTAKQLPSIGVNPDAAIQDLLHFQKNQFACLVLAAGEQHALDLQTHLREQGVRSAVDFQLKKMPAPGQTIITVGSLSGGIEYTNIRIAVMTEGERSVKKRKTERKTEKESSNRQKVKSYADLTPGDLVIHEHHGLGRYVGMVKMTVDGLQKDYVKLSYAGSDVLYVPATSLDLISKYIGAGENNEKRKLNKLGGQDWEKSKAKAKKAVQDLARGLVKLYAEREKIPGHAFAPDGEWQKEFEDSFEFMETEDQLRSAKEIKADMEKSRPMDRLLCGDVGYGKTEVAFRAVMKCVMDGKQAAMLAPTTVLARQHYMTAIKRFEDFPVEIDVLSRFRTGGQVKDMLKRVKNGEIDFLIGTHRLFNQDVQFKDLGLLIIDEEQRFGVRHKEKLKQKFKQVDVLTLSATPIPRTLNMALSGIRDMSTLEEPPLDRQPVQTYVLEHDMGVLADAMRRELERGGQVFYLHNRVETIDSCAAKIQSLIPDVNVAIAHGRMDQATIDEVMSRMTDGEIQILVCTTIIETGIDLPNVNTLIIEDADRLGLAQLHQIRGRVGRSSRRAFAYLTYRSGKVLSEVAEKRLSAIREFAEFGSGFKIAMRDLEIRGAGNVLGPEQSGFMLSVGYDMYLKMLEEAVMVEQGVTPVEERGCSASLTIPASVPDQYVSSPDQRMDLYQRIASLQTQDDANDFMDELIDRYGDPPRSVTNLIAIALLRAEAAKVGITDIDQRKEMLTLKSPKFNEARVHIMCTDRKYRGRLTYTPGTKPSLTLKLLKTDNSLRMAQTLVREYSVPTDSEPIIPAGSAPGAGSGSSTPRQTSGTSMTRQFPGSTGYRQTSGPTTTRQTTGSTGYRQTSGSTTSWQTPGSTGYHQTSGSTTSRQTTGSTGYRQTTGSTTSRQTTGSTGYRHTSGSTTSQQTIGSTGYCQTTGSTTSRQTTGSTGYRHTSGSTTSRQTPGSTGYRQTSGTTTSRQTTGSTGYRQTSGSTTPRQTTGSTGYRQTSGSTTSRQEPESTTSRQTTWGSVPRQNGRNNRPQK